jgi:predicted dehydrogenase
LLTNLYVNDILSISSHTSHRNVIYTQTQIQFGWEMNWNTERLFSKELGGGSVLDLAVYPVSWATMIYGCAPNRIMAMGMSEGRRGRRKKERNERGLSEKG